MICLYTLRVYRGYKQNLVEMDVLIRTKCLRHPQRWAGRQRRQHVLPRAYVHHHQRYHPHFGQQRLEDRLPPRETDQPGKGRASEHVDKLASEI